MNRAIAAPTGKVMSFSRVHDADLVVERVAQGRLALAADLFHRHLDGELQAQPVAQRTQAPVLLQIRLALAQIDLPDCLLALGLQLLAQVVLADRLQLAVVVLQPPSAC